MATQSDEMEPAEHGARAENSGNEKDQGQNALNRGPTPDFSEEQGHEAKATALHHLQLELARPKQVGMASKPADDSLYQTVSAQAAKGMDNASMPKACFRCKRFPPDCKGVSDCSLQSNAFVAKKSLKCMYCYTQTIKGETIVTKVWYGRLGQKYLHRACALTYLQTEGKDLVSSFAPTHNHLTFHAPPPDLLAYVDHFVGEEDTHKVYSLEMTAGGGKSNAIVAAVEKLRELQLSFKVLTFANQAVQELASRGLVAGKEVSNFHSHLKKPFDMWTLANVTERQVMASDSPGTSPKIEATLVPQKIRMVVSLFFKDFEHPSVYVKLHRPFVASLADLARTHGFGTPDGPCNFDTEELATLAEKYSLITKLENAWTGLLTLPEKEYYDRVTGAGDEARLEYAIEVTAQVLALSFQCATETTVNGCTTLYNEEQKKHIRLPVVDHKDYTLISVAKQLDFGAVDRLIVDEGQDVDLCELQGVKGSVKPGGKILFLHDFNQVSYAWLGVEVEKIRGFLKDAHKFVESANWRCATKICEEAQPFLTRMGSEVIIKPMRDVEGKVVTASFETEPIDVSKDTIILARTKVDLFSVYTVLLGKGYKVHYHTKPNTAISLCTLLNTLKVATLEKAIHWLEHHKRTSAAVNDTNQYDMVMALLIWIRRCIDTKGIDSSMPSSIQAFEEYIHSEFNGVEKEGTVGAIRFFTLHAAKGSAASTVYLVNPSKSPLQDRIDGKDFEAHEELCLAFVARTRARDRLVKLPEMDNSSRDEVCALFRPIEQAMIEEPTTSPPKTAMASAEPNEAQEEEVIEALRVLELTAIPENFAALDVAVKKLLLQVHPDRNLGSDASKNRAQDVLKARKVIKAKLDRKGP